MLETWNWKPGNSKLFCLRRIWQLLFKLPANRRFVEQDPHLLHRAQLRRRLDQYLVGRCRGTGNDTDNVADLKPGRIYAVLSACKHGLPYLNVDRARHITHLEQVRLAGAADNTESIRLTDLADNSAATCS